MCLFVKLQANFRPNALLNNKASSKEMVEIKTKRKEKKTRKEILARKASSSEFGFSMASFRVSLIIVNRSKETAPDFRQQEET